MEVTLKLEPAEFTMTVEALEHSRCKGQEIKLELCRQLCEVTRLAIQEYLRTREVKRTSK